MLQDGAEHNNADDVAEATLKEKYMHYHEKGHNIYYGKGILRGTLVDSIAHGKIALMALSVVMVVHSVVAAVIW